MASLGPLLRGTPNQLVVGHCCWFLATDTDLATIDYQHLPSTLTIMHHDEALINHQVLSIHVPTTYYTAFFIQTKRHRRHCFVGYRLSATPHDHSGAEEPIAPRMVCTSLSEKRLGKFHSSLGDSEIGIRESKQIHQVQSDFKWFQDCFIYGMLPAKRKEHPNLSKQFLWTETAWANVPNTKIENVAPKSGFINPSFVD